MLNEVKHPQVEMETLLPLHASERTLRSSRVRYLVKGAGLTARLACLTHCRKTFPPVAVRWA